ncbi:MAG: PKD domain-containing protein [Candidatus Margulisiibacteriota bacterium]
MDIYDGPNLVGRYENGMCYPVESSSPKNIKPEPDPRGSLPLPHNIMPRQPLTLADFNPFALFIGCVHETGSSACQSLSDGIGSFSMNIPDGINQYSIPAGTPIEFTVAVTNSECVDPSKISITLETGKGNFPLTYANGQFSTTQNADRAWGKPVKIVVRDSEGKVLSSQSFNDFAINAPGTTGTSGNYQAGINTNYEVSGQYARRPVTLSPNWLSQIPEGTLNYTWEVKDPDGNPVDLTTSGNNATFTPMREGTYSASLTITGDKLEKPLSVQKSDIIVYPFPAPTLKIDGNLYPKGETTQSYLPVLIPSEYRPEFGPEDEAATCSFRLYHFFNGAPVEDKTAEQSCLVSGQPNPFSFSFPEVAINTNYYLEVKAVGGDNSYEIARTETISVAPSGTTTTVTGDFTVATPYSERLAHRPIVLNAQVIAGAASYRWEIVAKDNVAYPTPILMEEGASPTVTHTFDESGKYAIRLTVLDANQEVMATVTKEGAEALEIYPFPAPPVSINLNNNNGISVGQPINVAALIGRDWPEDNTAQVDWVVSQDVPDPANPGQATNIPLYSMSGKNVTPVFDSSGTFRLDMTVTGANGAYTVTKTQFVDVYAPYTGTPQVLISGNLDYSYNQGETATNISGWTDSTDPDAKYRWTITRPDLTTQTVNSKDIPSFSFSQTGEYAFKLEVLDGNNIVIGSASRSVNVYPGGAATPEASISGNLKYSYHQGESAANITGYSTDNDPNNQYEWTVVSPDPNDPSQFITTPYSGQTIASVNFPVTGEYIFTFTVKDAQGNIKTTAARKVNVYENTVPLPQASIVGPFSGKMGEAVPFTAGIIDGTQYTYTWDFGDGTFGTGPTPPPHAFAKEGTYTVKLIMARIDDPSVKDEVTQKITIVKQSVNPPAIGVTIPYAAEEDTPVPMSITLPNPQTDWEVSWEFADGKPAGTGADTMHQFDNPGKYQVVAKVKSTVDGSEYFVPFIITIVPHGAPVPNLVINPGSGPAPLNVVADAGNSYTNAAGASLVNYAFNWGDGSPVESGSASSLPHTFACGGTQACTYTVKVTIEDNFGNKSDLTTVVSTWPI